MPHSRKVRREEPEELPVSPTDYNAFIEGIQLRSIRLSKCEIDAQDRFDDSELTPSVEEGTSSYELVDRGFLVRQELKFQGAPRSSETNPVRIAATFELVFDSEADLTEDLFNVFRRVNLPVNVWPFFREFVHTALARVGWPVFLLPALKVGNRSTSRPRRVRASARRSE